MKRAVFCILAGLLVPHSAFAHEQSVHAHATPVRADVAITRVDSARWRVDYSFDAPITVLDLGPAAVAYRAAAWRVLTPGAALVTQDGSERVVARDSAVTRLSVEVQRYTDYAHDRYAPQVPFSDGGAALYVGFFSGNVTTADGPADVSYRFRYAGRAGEHVLPQDGDDANAYIYFGPQRPVATSHARVIIDPGTPAWLVETLARVAEQTTGIFAARLGDLVAPPLVLVGAGELDMVDGMSVKGGVVGDQFVMLVRGRGLHAEAPGTRAAFERLTAHELAHLWQVHTLPTGFNEAEPWLHEGAAEAMAVHALAQARLWDDAAVAEFAAQAATRCTNALGGRTLADPAARANGDVAYACGFGLFHPTDMDPLTLWARFAEAVTRDGAPQTIATLQRLRSPAGTAR